MFKQNYKETCINIKKSHNSFAVHVWSWRSIRFDVNDVKCKWTKLQHFFRSESNETFSSNEQMNKWQSIRFSNQSTFSVSIVMNRDSDFSFCTSKLISGSAGLSQAVLQIWPSEVALNPLTDWSYWPTCSVAMHAACGHPRLHLWNSDRCECSDWHRGHWNQPWPKYRPALLSSSHTIQFVRKKSRCNPNRLYIKTSIKRILFQTISR